MLLRLFSRRKARRLLAAWNIAKADVDLAKERQDTRRQHEAEARAYATFHAKLRQEMGR